jgi:hypothetical protein
MAAKADEASLKPAPVILGTLAPKDPFGCYPDFGQYKAVGRGLGHTENGPEIPG